MTPTAQRIAIAEFLGWKWKAGCTIPFGAEKPINCWHDPSGRGSESIRPPNFPRDLNAMRSALSRLRVEGENSQSDDYALNLLRLVAYHRENPDKYDPNFKWGDQCDADFFLVSSAPPAKCIEALLRTIGKWVDE